MNKSSATPLADAFMLFVKEAAPTAARSKWGQVESRWFDCDLGEMPITEVRLKTFENKLDSLILFHYYKRETLKTDKKILMRFFRWAKEAGLIQTNPIADWRVNWRWRWR